MWRSRSARRTASRFCRSICAERTGDAQKRAILAGVETLRGEFGDTLGSLRVETAEVCDDDWRDNWKQFFHPLEIGEKFVVRPSWEPYAGIRPLEIVIDPESSFGTASMRPRGSA